MCLFSEMLWAKKCRNSSGGDVSLSQLIFTPCRKSGTTFLFYCICQQIIRGNIDLIYYSFYQLVVIMGKNNVYQLHTRIYICNIFDIYDVILYLPTTYRILYLKCR